MKKTVCDQGLDGRVVWEMKRGSGSRALAGECLGREGGFGGMICHFILFKSREGSCQIW